MDSVDKSIQVRYRKRDSGAIITEVVLMEAGLRYLYENPLGLQIFNLVLNHAFICWLHSKWQDTSISRKNIVKFAYKYNIDLSEIELPIRQYSSFNAFFCRRLKAGSRNFNKSADILVSPADGKVLIYPNLGENTLLPVKGSYCTIAQILNCEKTTKFYQNGSALIIRLSPADYHRFHFIDNGIANKVREIKGKYHSVNPIALSAVPDIYCRNKRVITEFDADNFGCITYVEIGAFCIGTIV
ncbi:MAG: archaetidylserine decarboxylase, partial [Cyanobacteriota bacterium]|nr:archaetidylserine decarboxylase [Cyanobacteriota bacterium]